ncbi:unnamed protein product, partial [Nesidiocoris tenuis]
ISKSGELKRQSKVEPGVSGFSFSSRLGFLGSFREHKFPRSPNPIGCVLSGALHFTLFTLCPIRAGARIAITSCTIVADQC